MVYYPPKFEIVEVEFDFENGKKTEMRVFGDWSEEWRLNSGIESMQTVGNMVYFHGNSGSLYVVERGNYGVGMHAQNWLADLAARAGKAKIRSLSFNEAMEFVKSNAKEISHEGPENEE